MAAALRQLLRLPRTTSSMLPPPAALGGSRRTFLTGGGIDWAAAAAAAADTAPAARQHQVPRLPPDRMYHYCYGRMMSDEESRSIPLINEYNFPFRLRVLFFDVFGIVVPSSLLLYAISLQDEEAAAAASATPAPAHSIVR